MMAPTARPKRSLAKGSGRPLHLQLYEILRDDVRHGVLKPGDLVPAESELVKAYGVSRITVRAALEHLVREGYIDRHRGRGSFVRAAIPEVRACLTSFTDQMLALGRNPGSRVLDVRVAVADAFAMTASPTGQSRLPFDAGVEVVRIERLRTVDGDALAVVRSFIPHALVPGIGPHAFAERGPAQSLLHVLEHRYGVTLDKGEETIAPARADADTAFKVGIAEGDAIAIKACLVRDTSGAPVLYEVAAWCAPQTQLVQRMSLNV